MSSVKLNLRELLDIALPAPDMEVINFHILHKLLNAMIEALQMDEMQVDLSTNSLIPTKDESTETVQTLESESGKRDDDDKNTIHYDDNRTQNQAERDYTVATENMAEKLNEMDTQITCLNDYVIQCMRAISASIGLKNLPQPSATEAEMAADRILCDIIQSVEVVPIETPVCERLTDLEHDQLKQWDNVIALNTAFEKYTKDTVALIEDVKLLKCKSKQMLDDYTRYVANTETTFESQNRTNESAQKRLKVMMSMLEREKKLTNCSLKSMESLLDQKVERYDLEGVKEYIKSKVKELSTRPNSGSKKIVKPMDDSTEIQNRNNCGNTTSKATVSDKINERWAAISNTLALFNDKDMKSCNCSYMKGANGSVYRTNCICCKPKTPNT